MSTNTAGELGPVGAALVSWMGAGYLFTMDTLSFNIKLLVGGVLVTFGIVSILGAIR